MARRLVDFAENLSEGTTASTTVVNHLQIVAPLENGKTYAILWSYQWGGDDTSTVLRTRVMDTTGSTQLALTNQTIRDTTDYVWQGGVSRYVAAATANRTFSLEFRRNSGTGTMKFKTCRILVLELGAEDQSAATLGNQITNSATLVSALDLTFTPATGGDYLFLATACLGNGGNTDAEFTTPGGTSVNSCAGNIMTNGSFAVWGAMWVETLSAVSSTASIRWRSRTGTNQNIQSCVIVAIRLDALHSAQTTQDDAADSGTSTSYTTTETVSATSLEANVRDTVAIYAVTLSNSSTTESSYIEAREDSTVMMEGLHEARSAAGTSVFGMLAYQPTSSSSSIVFDLRRKSEGVNTTGVQFAAVAVLELNGSFPQAMSATLTGTASIRKSVQKRLAATLTMTATLLARVLFTCALVAGMAMTASMRREVHKGLSATLTATGTIVKTVHKALSAACTLTGSIAKAFPVHLVASLTATASMTRTIYKFLSGPLPMTGVLGKIKAVVVNMSASLGMTATLRASTLFIRSLSASITLSATVQRTISKMLSAPLPVIARPIAWVASMFAATRHDKPNWNQCARCWRKQRPNKMHQQMEYRGPRLVWTGAYVCHSCLDDPQPQEIWPRETGGDPKPVILARPRRD
jgi:hypothetical protein